MKTPDDLEFKTLDELARIVFAHEWRDDFKSRALVEACRAEVKRRIAELRPSESRKP